MIEQIQLSKSRIDKVSLDFKRYLFDKINWSNRLIGIKGARGVGKSTLILQWLKEQQFSIKEAVYFTLDDLYFTQNSLLNLAVKFYQSGGKVIVLDEVHKYPNWSITIKNLYDRYDDLKIIFTGSSIIEISKQEADLSRRALIYELKGLSYREFLNYEYDINLNPITINQLMESPGEIEKELPTDFKPYAYFDEFLKHGYYPFYKSDKDGYYQRLVQLVRTVVEYDMAEMKGFDIRHAKKLLQLLYVVSQQVPFKPNIQKLAEKTGIHRNSINNYLYFLQEAKLLQLLYSEGISISTLQKPEKIYLENTNLLFALSEQQPEAGTIREVFFVNQLSGIHAINHAKKTDFHIDNKYYFEIGGKNKKGNQIQGLTNARIVKDNLEFPIYNELPLWMFGMLY